ncbi:Hypp7786 [Branchiostoma lanceolatum]|uniref:Hypp7786 protein n=1 Tax=Branchiostoma lanceolatum TaxID=7740 RepID=A0A8J9Z420_BRALA|nr:Hypp7786 [Branchiostoma lanceolatum]
MEAEKQQLAPSASCEHVDAAAITPGSATTPDAACILCQICTRPSEKKEKLKEIPADGNTPEKAEKEAMEKDSLKPKDNDEEKEKNIKKPKEEV